MYVPDRPVGTKLCAGCMCGSYWSGLAFFGRPVAQTFYGKRHQQHTRRRRVPAPRACVDRAPQGVRWGFGFGFGFGLGLESGVSRAICEIDDDTRSAQSFEPTGPAHSYVMAGAVLLQLLLLLATAAAAAAVCRRRYTPCPSSTEETSYFFLGILRTNFIIIFRVHHQSEQGFFKQQLSAVHVCAVKSIHCRLAHYGFLRAICHARDSKV